MKRVAVFCGSSKGKDASYAEAARALGLALAERGLGLVYGGGQIGLMGVLADAVMGAGGEAIGVIPQALFLKEVAHEGLTELRVVGSMHERKALMAELADAFIALPGGFGTFEEFCEILTWAQLGLHTKPCGLLNIKGYYNPLVELFDRGLREGFLRPQHRALVIEETDPGRMLSLLRAWDASQIEPVAKWIGAEDT